MSGDAWNIALNIIASAITGSAVWLSTKALALRRLRREQVFFGLTGGDECLVVVPRHASSDRRRSVHRNDAAALLELSSVLGDCRARPEVVFHDDVYQGLAGKAEFCIGGPDANERTAAHLRSMLPGVRVSRHDRDPEELTIAVGEHEHPAETGRLEHVVLAKIVRRDQDRPAFLICGQSSISNRAATRYLQDHYRELARAHGLRGRFCLVLRVVESHAYGPSVVELVRDATAEAFTAPEVAGAR
ncbi:hypothetical protein [Saccharopolyspora griseoalba]|uniref:RdRp catalytic domain-containing protein n=1 Tax=Saccharopolyspora griseoalba TaxID=1431848 RepID=A0ABW2LQW6_9PSEU